MQRVAVMHNLGGSEGEPLDLETVASGEGVDDVVSGGSCSGLDDGDSYRST
jgi:hypothetical protein